MQQLVNIKEATIRNASRANNKFIRSSSEGDNDEWSVSRYCVQDVDEVSLSSPSKKVSVFDEDSEKKTESLQTESLPYDFVHLQIVSFCSVILMV